MSIDMNPYTFEHLSDPEAPLEEDQFELVGVLVHKGQAEHGHYISYIRTRPTSESEEPRWLLFDDADVTEFDPQEIPEACFGGSSDGKDNSPYTSSHGTVKAYNAYMLFYQRSSSLKRAQASGEDGLRKAQLPDGMEQELQRENAVHLRTHCLYGSVHQEFMRQLCSVLKESDHFDGDHRFYQYLLETCLSHLCKVASRTKDYTDFEGLLNMLRDVVQGCGKCNYLVFQYFANNNLHELRDMLTRSPSLKVRQPMQSFILHQLKHLRFCPELYGIDTESTTLALQPKYAEKSLPVALELLLQIAVNETHYHIKGWDELFGLLSQIANLGRYECWMMLERGFLTICLEYLMIHVDDDLKQRYIKVARMFDKRTPAHNNLAELLRALLCHTDLARWCYPDARMDEFDDETKLLPLSERERKLIIRSDSEGFFWLLRLFEKWDAGREVRMSEQFVPGAIVALLLRNLDVGGVKVLYDTIRDSIESLSPFYVEPYLRAAIYFCQECPERPLIREMTRSMNKIAANNEGNGGTIVLAFFENMSRLVNPKISPKYPGLTSFYCDTLLNLHSWGAALLVCPDDAAVRYQTFTVIHKVLLGYPPMADSTASSPQEVEKLRTKAVRSLFDNCLDKARIALGADTGKSFLHPLVGVMRECAEYIMSLQKLGANAAIMKNDEQDGRILDSFNSECLFHRQFNLSC
jgi:ubiquitin carboxyl-terminal hydrolase 34